MQTEQPLLALAGNIATGKSTLLGPLATRLGLESYPEQWQQNPWFADAGRSASHMVSSQLWFLVDSAAQVLRAANAGGVLERWPDEHVFVFAQTLLEGGDAAILKNCHARLVVDLPTPELLIFLRASPEALLRRVRERNRPQERDLTLERLRALDLAYRRVFGDWRNCPVVDIDTESIDVRSESGIDVVINLVVAHLQPNKERHA